MSRAKPSIAVPICQNGGANQNMPVRRSRLNGALVIIDKHSATRNAFVQALQKNLPDIAVFGLATTDALAHVHDRTVRLVALSIRHGAVTEAGILLELSAIKRHLPDAAIVLMYECSASLPVPALLEAGVRGLLPVAMPLDVMVTGLRLVLAEQVCIHLPITLPLEAMIASLCAVMNGRAGAYARRSTGVLSIGSAGRMN